LHHRHESLDLEGLGEVLAGTHANGMTTLVSYFEGPLVHAYASLAAECWWALDGQLQTAVNGGFGASQTTRSATFICGFGG
jgi:hypothetical protein